MCFLNEDYDWIARVNEWSLLTAAKPQRCDECDGLIEPGEIVHHLHQQEYEECGRCFDDADDGCSCEEDKCCQCPEPYLGESYEHDECDRCHRFLAAVRAAEVAAGCHPAESRPPLSRMVSDIQEQGPEEAKKYYRQALAMFPDLHTSGYLPALWRTMFAA